MKLNTGKTKLRPVDVRAIRAHPSKGLKALQRHYDISRGCINSIRSRRRHGSVQ